MGGDEPDGCERLWRFLMSRYERLPDREAIYRKALERVSVFIKDQSNEPAEAVPF